MTKKLMKHGNSQMIYLPKAFLDQLDIKINDLIEVKFDGTKIILQKKEGDSDVL